MRDVPSSSPEGGGVAAINEGVYVSVTDPDGLEVMHADITAWVTPAGCARRRKSLASHRGSFGE